jgi:hypothetical protein
MSSKQYNMDRVSAGAITGDHITVLTKAYQKSNGLKQDGYCGPATISSIDAGLAPSTSCSLGEEALRIAILEIGNGEVGGNNSGPHIAKYKGIADDGNPDDDGAWCASFVGWCFETAARNLGVELPFRRSHGAKRIFQYIGDSGDYVTMPAAGDVVCWDRGVKGSWQGHIGIVEKIENGILYTVEGNVGRYPSIVRRFQHNMDLQTRLEGFARSPL